MAWTDVCELQELEEGVGKYVRLGDFQLAVFRHEGRVYAIDNRCAHAGASLSGGCIQEGHVVCPWHQWAFRLSDGQLQDTPHVKVASYEVRMRDEGGEAVVQVKLPDELPGAGKMKSVWDE